MIRYDISGKFRLDGGKIYWVTPPPQRAFLVGAEAGSPIPNAAGKVYWAIQINGRKVRRSHVVFYLTRGRWPENQIDHIDGDSLNDDPTNLREATVTQNAWNHKRRAKKSHTPMGVRLTAEGRYQARIGVNKRQIALGTFDTPERAVDVYKKARLQYFGEFA